MKPIQIASAFGHYDIVKWLLQYTKQDLEKGDKYGRTPLILATRNGHIKIVSLLIQYKANVNSLDTSGNSALHYAAAYGFIECLEFLIKLNADPNCENLWKTNPLQIALLKKNFQCVALLLEKTNVNVNALDDQGRTLVGLAIQSFNDHGLTLKLITDHNVDPNLQDAEGNTPLIIAIQRIIEKKTQKKKYDQELTIAQLLIQKGSNSSLMNKKGESALRLCMSNKINQLIELLWEGFSFTKDPQAFFSFTKEILDTGIQDLILRFLDSKLDYEVINCIDTEGFSPFLRYIQTYVNQFQNIELRVNWLLQTQKHEIDNQIIINTHQTSLNIQNHKLRDQILEKEISHPFINFLQKLIDYGADPLFQVQKLQQFRDIKNEDLQKHYSENGLSNSLHIVLKYPE